MLKKIVVRGVAPLAVVNFMSTLLIVIGPSVDVALGVGVGVEVVET